MGNSVASLRAPLPLAPSLPLKQIDAFALATAWRDVLWDFVHVASSADYDRESVLFMDANHDIHRHFDWVEFGFPYARGERRYAIDQATAAAQVSTVVWLAIASVPGFSARENPRFWKRVFSSLVGGTDGRKQIADMVRFFDQEDCPFPRVRLRPRRGEENPMLRTFFTLDNADRELMRVLAMLKSNSEWWRCEVPVEIVKVSFAALAQLPPSVYQPTTRPPDAPPAPTLRLVGIRAPTICHHVSLMAVQTLATATASGVALEAAFCDLKAHISTDVLTGVLRSASLPFHIGAYRLRSSSPDFAAICSVVPHRHFLSSLSMKRDATLLELDDAHAAWLGYALFHPDAIAHSSFTTLELSLCNRCWSVVDALRKMAKGNNLLVALGLTDTLDTSTAYHAARVVAGTTAYTQANDHATEVFCFAVEASVTLCVEFVEDLENDVWVRVVIPGVGLGWVHTTRIVSVTSRPPGVPTLKRLELTEMTRSDLLIDHDLHAATVALLSVLGASLTHLAIKFKIPTDVLQSVLRVCPQLQALRVHNDDECWSNPSIVASTPPLPHLQTLELYISAPFQPLVASQLHELTCLRVLDVGEDRESFDVHREALLTTLQRYPQLSHVYWSSKGHKAWWEKSKFLPWSTPTAATTRRDDWQTTSYGLLGESIRGVGDVSYRPLRVDTRVAFLSVVAATPTRLPTDVVRLIWAFGARSTPRQLLVRHNVSDPCE